MFSFTKQEAFDELKASVDSGQSTNRLVEMIKEIAAMNESLDDSYRNAGVQYAIQHLPKLSQDMIDAIHVGLVNPPKYLGEAPNPHVIINHRFLTGVSEWHRSTK